MNKPFLCTAASRTSAALASVFVAAAPAQNQGPSPSPTTWEAPAEARLLQNPMKGDGRTVERGKRLFRQHCVPCHGETGVGDGAMARKLGYKPANLALERLNQQTDGEVFWKISKGKDPMPDFAKEMSARERWDVVSYVRTLLKVTQ
jgi:mono/diheme cytochrome c family protein